MVLGLSSSRRKIKKNLKRRKERLSLPSRRRGSGERDHSLAGGENDQCAPSSLTKLITYGNNATKCGAHYFQKLIGFTNRLIGLKGMEF
jgi:hypothetical protein